jgi:menaquinone-dependent protoporphyrinogen oxidase
MSRILVAYASHFGQTQKIARRIADHLHARGHHVELADALAGSGRMPPPEDYDAVVIGSRIETGRHAPQIRSYLRAHRETLRELPTGFFSVSMAASSPGAGADPEGYLGKLFAEVGWTPSRAVAFGGGLPYRSYGWFLRFVMKQISRHAGHPTDTSRDHELTDWNAVGQFADDIADLVPVVQPSYSRA